MRKPALSVDRVLVSYGSAGTAVRALDHVTIAFEAGRVALVMGPSGSGKTTLLSVLGCLLTPDSGDVRLMGEQVSVLPEEERSRLRREYIGYIFQAFRLFRSLSALENVAIALEISGMRGRHARELAFAALESVGLADRSKLRPDELSGGQKQRVAIARALACNPPIILADEPTASLPSGDEIGRLLMELAERDRRLVVVVSHDPRLIPFSHRTVTLQEGKLLSDTG